MTTEIKEHTASEIVPLKEKLVQIFKSTLSKAKASVDYIVTLFSQIRPLYILWRGASKGAALCGRLVLEEVVRYPAITLGDAEFRHGPIEVLDKKFGAIIFISKGVSGHLSLSLAQNISLNGGRVLTIGEVEEKRDLNYFSFPITGLPTYLHPVVDIIPIQMLAYKLAESKGYNPCEIRFISKLIREEEGISYS
jgi:glucosamine--fructose-6-phosphate aminotransferase (isomerizing)